MRTFAVAVAVALVSSGCVHYTPYTAAQLAEKGTHHVPLEVGPSVEAVAASLATLGYRVTLKNAERGVVKTSAKSIMTSSRTSATGNSYSATATSEVVEDGLAWAIEVRPDPNGGSIVTATPRGFRNGAEIQTEGMWVAEVMDPLFRDLWREVDSTVGPGR